MVKRYTLETDYACGIQRHYIYEHDEYAVKRKMIIDSGLAFAKTVLDFLNEEASKNVSV